MNAVVGEIAERIVTPVQADTVRYQGTSLNKISSKRYIFLVLSVHRFAGALRTELVEANT